jgi:hypothetical protein
MSDLGALKRAGRQLSIINYQLPTTNYQLPITKLQIMRSHSQSKQNQGLFPFHVV